MPRSLVSFIAFVAEGRCMQIKSNRKILRLLLIQDLKQNIQKTVYRIRMDPGTVCKKRDPVECPVQ